MVELSDMRLFIYAVNCGSLSAAGRVLGFSPAVGSKRLARIETRLGVRLIQRTSRRMTLTEEGAAYFERCQAILAAAEEAENLVAQGRRRPSGTLQVSAPVALGRRWIGPALAEFSHLYPELKIYLSLTDSIVDLVESGVDCAVRIGDLADSRLVVRKLADNQRIICAAPAYLQAYGVPQLPQDLTTHHAILLGGQTAHFANWRLISGEDTPVTTTAQAQHGRSLQVSVPVRLSTDNGEQAHDWALAGLGLVRRSYWDVAHEIAEGTLVRILPDWLSEEAPLQLVFPSRQFLPARTRLFIDYLVEYFEGKLQRLQKVVDQ